MEKIKLIWREIRTSVGNVLRGLGKVVLAILDGLGDFIEDLDFGDFDFGGDD